MAHIELIFNYREYLRNEIENKYICNIFKDDKFYEENIKEVRYQNNGKKKYDSDRKKKIYEQKPKLESKLRR